MTIIKPQVSDAFIRWVLFTLVLTVAAAAVTLVFFYNRTANIQHAIDEAERGVKDITIQSAELQDQMFALFDTARMQELAAERGLVKELSPRYVEMDSWSLASQY